MSTVILTLIASGSTEATRRAAFPADEPLEPTSLVAARAMAATIRRVDTALTSPALCATQTADALGLAADADPALRDLDYGTWSGRSLEQVAATDPAGATAWMTDTAARPHGGEPIDALLARVATWMAAFATSQGRTVAITHPTVIRAAVVAALGSPPQAFWRIDVAPLCRVRLRRAQNGWTLVAFGP